MKLIRAEFENFRFLRDLNLEFSTDPARKLTVIRAANESGKTTLLHGLQWALYGDDALPGKGEDFRLHPIDWQATDGRRVPITATVEFEVTTMRRSASGMREQHTRYRLIRSTFEEIDSTARRPRSVVKLFALGDTGTSPIDAPEALLTDELPPELREVFFTDGDRALSFIEADAKQSTKRDRVQRAIRSLLGLEVLKEAIKHVRIAAAEVNKHARQIDASGELNVIATRLEAIEKDSVDFEGVLDDAKQQFAAFEEKANDTEKKIATALQRGDKEKLKKDLEQTKRRLKQLDEQLAAANKEHSALFRSQALAHDLLAPVLVGAYAMLDELREQGRIPNTTIPVLQDRLAEETCICGESLRPGTADCDRRREHIERLIRDSQSADELQETITALYYEARPQAGGQWLADYRAVLAKRDELQTLRDDTGREYRALEQQVDAIPDTDIQGLRETLRGYRDQRDRFMAKGVTIETKLVGLKREREELTVQRDQLLREQKKGARILAELDVTQDVIGVLERSYEYITKEELKKVSDLMNAIFLEMIGADPEQGAIIRRAEVSAEFDILVYGPNDRPLNPDRDLNGASRRALTLAFILALTKVSEVEAPNVIDTPLGMTSGYVKRAMLRTAIRESSQLVLFLTHDEIAGCESILDEAAGVIITLTNPAHYPKQLVNDPHAVARKALRCDCDHRHDCQLCQRRTDAQVLADRNR